MSVYADAVAAAKKVLGKEGELPKPKVDLNKIGDEFAKAYQSFKSALDELEKQLVEFVTAGEKVKAATKQYANICDGDDFGLDAKNADNKKKIADATKIMLGALGKIEDDMDRNETRLDKLDRVLTDIRRLDDVKV